MLIKEQENNFIWHHVFQLNLIYLDVLSLSLFLFIYIEITKPVY